MTGIAMRHPSPCTAFTRHHKPFMSPAHIAQPHAALTARGEARVRGAAAVGVGAFALSSLRLLGLPIGC